MKRRTFLKGLGSGLAGVVLPGLGRATQAPDALGDIGRILGGGRFQHRRDGPVHHVLSILDAGARSPHLVSVDFLPHGIVLDPLDDNRAILFEKIGAGACEVDLVRRVRTRAIPPARDRRFYGHGAFSPDGALLFSTETYGADERGVIAVRDGRSLALVSEFPTYGENPHDCHLVDGGRVMVATNGGGAWGSDRRPSVTWVDVASQSLLEKVELDDERINSGHLALASDGSLIVVSAPRAGLSSGDPGGVSIRPVGSNLLTRTGPREVNARMRGEALSIAVQEPRGIAAVTHPDGDMITFWSLGDGRCLKALALPGARGVTLSRDGEAFVVSHGSQGNLIGLSAATLSPIRDAVWGGTFLSGSHLVNWHRVRNSRGA